MQVTVENSGGLQRRLTVQVPAGEVRGKIDERLREIGKTARLKGFRPGRVPMTVLKQRFGQSVMAEVLEGTVRDSSAKLLEERQVFCRPLQVEYAFHSPQMDPARAELLESQPP